MLRLRTIVFTALTVLACVSISDASDKSGADTSNKKAAVVKTGIEWKVVPSHVVVWLNGKKLGEAGSLKVTETKPGKHAVKLTRGGDETEMEVSVKKGEVVKFEFEFTDA
jgi:hypothetical protein